MSDPSTSTIPPVHGGNLQQAIKIFGGKASEWLDLSTGISPYSWPVREVVHLAPEQCWQQLPDQDLYRDAQLAAQSYYAALIDSENKEPVLAAGTQAIIQRLPDFFANCVFKRDCQQLVIWLMAGSYGEHQFHWRQAGARVVEKSEAELRRALAAEEVLLADIVLLVNPDNPSGVLWSKTEVLQWQYKLQQQGGWLILDAAFADVSPSVGGDRIPAAENQLVLTSVGKFFGLAGLRFGGCFVPQPYAAGLRQKLGPWPVTGLTLWLVAQALADKQWQKTQHGRIHSLHQRLLDSCCDLPVYGSSGLFVTLKSELAESWQQQLAKHRIWTRCFKQQQLLRIGLPRETELGRVINVLKKLTTD